MTSFPTGVQAAQAVGLTGAAWLSGNIGALSFITVPAIHQSIREDNLAPSTTAKLFRNMYNRGKAQNPPIAAATAAAFLYLSWAVKQGTTLSPLSQGNSSALYASAAALALGILPWTLAAMTKTNSALLAAAEGEVKPEADVGALLGRWKTLNGVRAVFPFAAAVLGFVAGFSWPIIA